MSEHKSIHLRIEITRDGETTKLDIDVSPNYETDPHTSDYLLAAGNRRAELAGSVILTAIASLAGEAGAPIGGRKQ